MLNGIFFRFFFISLFSLVVFKNGLAQDAKIRLVVNYTPNSIYLVTSTTSSSTTVDLLAADSIKKRHIKLKGAEFPAQLTRWRQTKNRLIIGKQEADGTSLMNVEILDDSIVDKLNGMPFTNESEINLKSKKATLRITASGTLEKVKQIDPTILPNISKPLSNIFDSYIDTMNFSDTSFSIGDTVIYSIPMRLHLFAANMNVTIYTVIVLERVEGERAIFSIASEVKMDVSEKDSSSVASIISHEEIVYNVKYFYIEQKKTIDKTSRRLVNSEATVLSDVVEEKTLQIRYIAQE